jgi:hypothetical protein
MAAIHAGVELMMKNFSWKTLLLATPLLFPHPVFAEAAAWHASLDAYPEARIVLKIPQTDVLLYVESDGKSVVALKEGQALWKVQPFQENRVCDFGAPVIRDLRFERGKLQIVFCKHSFGEIDLLSGQYRFLGQN